MNASWSTPWPSARPRSPLFSTATFIGYLLDGPVGAAADHVGIFLPAFVAVAISIPLLGALRGSATFRAFLDGVNAAAVGLLAVAAYRLGLDVIDDVLAVVVAVAAFVLLSRGVGPVWLIAAGPRWPWSRRSSSAEGQPVRLS